MEMNGNNVMDRTRYTYRERTLLLRLRKKSKNLACLQAAAKVDEKDMGIMLIHLRELYDVEGKDKNKVEINIKTDTIKLNQKGETVAQAEFDHRFELYFNRAISFLALLVSIAAIVVSVI